MRCASLWRPSGFAPSRPHTGGAHLKIGGSIRGRQPMKKLLGALIAASAASFSVLPNAWSVSRTGTTGRLARRPEYDRADIVSFYHGAGSHRFLCHGAGRLRQDRKRPVLQGHDGYGLRLPACSLACSMWHLLQATRKRTRSSVRPHQQQPVPDVHL